MQDDAGLTPAEKEVEAALGGLRPARATMDRDRILFDAGRASARRRHRIWQGISGCLGIALLVAVLYRPPATVVETSINTFASNAGGSSFVDIVEWRHESLRRAGPDPIRDYVRMRRAVLEGGIEALPVASPAPSTYDETLTEGHLRRVPSSI